MNDLFRKISRRVSNVVGKPAAFAAALLLIIVWGTTGTFFDFSDTWQLVINTATTIITFLMVFLIQNTQTRDSEAMQLKLDELIRSIRKARKRLIDLEDMSDRELSELEEEFRQLRLRQQSRGGTPPQ